jgi:hypothetical protein
MPIPWHNNIQHYQTRPSIPKHLHFRFAGLLEFQGISWNFSSGCPPIQDCHLSEMRVPWALQGAMCHNLVVALCIAPLLHADLSLAERCQVAVSGFCTLDIMQLLASSKASSMGMPVGACFMAKQTTANLQACALSAMIMTCTKPEDCCCWLGIHGKSLNLFKKW